MTKNIKTEFIKFLIECEALMFGDFTTKSGRRSPYFINTGKFKDGYQIKKLGEFYATHINDQIKNHNISEDTKVLFGPAYKGIPLVISTSIALNNADQNLNYCFNRKEIKDHGEGGSLVGYSPIPGDKVLIVEDVVTAGTAVREILPLLKSYELKVEGLTVSVDRMEKSNDDMSAIQSLYEHESIKTYPIITIKDILSELHNKTVNDKVYIDDNLYDRIVKYMKKYCI